MKTASFFLAFITTLACSAQEEVRLMSYNLLNFPTGNLQGRIDTLAIILDYHRPHLLMIQELTSEEGLSEITDAMDDIGYGDFAHSAFVPQQSNPGSEYALQQAIVYDQNTFVLKSQMEVITDIRDVNEYVLYLNDPGLATGSDTTFLYVYVTHLKSSTGTENENLRLSMVNDWLAHADATLDPDSRVIIAGDFNLYGNDEPAYQALMDPQNTIALHDVFGNYGNWSGSNFAHKEILTQSTRSSQIYNDGAGGGVDDRFDFILFSESLLSSSSPVRYTEGSYASLGNTGGCYNQSITECDAGNPVPANVLSAMYYMSDHIPQVCSLETELSLGTPVATQSDFSARQHGSRMLLRTSNPGPVRIEWFSMDGRLVAAENCVVHDGRVLLDPPHTATGLLLFRAVNTTGQIAVRRYCPVQP